MGQNLCCLLPPKEPSSGANDKEAAANPTPQHQHKPAAIVNVGKITTLREMMLNSPILDCKNVKTAETMKRVLYQTSPDFNNVFYTPRISFSSGKLEKIEELCGDEEEACRMCTRSKGGVIKKKVQFMLPHEAPADHVVLVYSPVRVN